jgi:5'-nucleotidase
MTPPTILLTNDDGVTADGITVLRSALIEAGARVSIVAPDGNRSGMARAISFSRPVTVTPAGGSRRDAVFACTGTPVDCVRVGVLSELVPTPDLVISGINHGLNVGDDVTYSGTVGAALEAALLDVPAIAFSQQADDKSFRFNDSVVSVSFTLAPYAAGIALALARRSPPGRIAININLPAGVAAPDVAFTRPGRRYYQRGFVKGSAGVVEPPEYYPYGLPSDPAPTFDDAADTDFAALRGGRISITPLAAAPDQPPPHPQQAWFRDVLAACAALAGAVKGGAEA